MKKYLLTGPAARDIDEILDYIAAQSVQNAVLVASRLEKAFQKLAETLNLGHERAEIKDSQVRVYFVSGYLILFDPFLRPLHILRVVRGSRNLRRIMPRPTEH